MARLRPGATGMQTEDVVERLVEPQPLVFARRIPAFQLDDELDPLRRPRRRDPEQIADVDQADAAQLHMMARHWRTGADEDGAAAPADVDDVVRDQAVAQADQ